MYRLTSQDENFVKSVIRISDWASIPMVVDNRDYRAYLDWLEEGNTPPPRQNL